MDAEKVEAASGDTCIVGRGHVWIPLNGGMFIEVYHVPEFSSNILSVGKLSKSFDVKFTEKNRPYNGCFIIDPNNDEIIYETNIRDGLYEMKIQPSSKYKVLAVNASKTDI